MSDSGFERIVTIRPAFDGRNGSDPKWRTPGMKPDDGTPNTDYGIHGCELCFVLKGPLGATQFIVYTDWFLPHVQEESSRRSFRFDRIQPQVADVGYHSPKPMYDGQTVIHGECPYLDGRPCYYDGSGLRADEWVRDILLPKGSDGVWAALEEDYRERFEGNGDD